MKYASSLCMVRLPAILKELTSAMVSKNLFLKHCLQINPGLAASKFIKRLSDMNTFKFVLANQSITPNNNVVYDQIFELHEYNYQFFIKPKTDLWRLGIRLSKTPTVTFFYPEKRYVDDVYDLYSLPIQ